MLAVMVRFYAKSGHEEVVEERMKVFADECMKTDPGTSLYTVIKDVDGRRTTELYDNMNALRSHGSTHDHDDNVRILSDKMAAQPEIKMFECVSPRSAGI